MCEICLNSLFHHPRCPNYTPQKATHYCSACKDGIYDDEKYIENLEGEYMHFDCVLSIKQLLEWLGYDVKTMDEMGWNCD